MKVLENNGKVMKNDKVNALTVENVTTVVFKITACGPFAISWGDNTQTSYSTIGNEIYANKTYSKSSTYNINFINPQNITKLTKQY